MRSTTRPESGQPAYVSGADRPTVEDAIVLAAQAHRVQRCASPDAELYVFHPLRVMLRSQDPVGQIASVLHDAIEDTDLTIDDLVEAGYTADVVAAIDCLTHRHGETYEDYIDRVARNDVGATRQDCGPRRESREQPSTAERQGDRETDRARPAGARSAREAAVSDDTGRADLPFGARRTAPDRGICGVRDTVRDERHAEMGETVGTISALSRFPVKSMQGEPLSAAEVTEGGVLGDRAYALVEADTAKVLSGKTPRLGTQLLGCRAAFVASPTPGQELPPVRITLPDGTSVTSDSGDADATLSTVPRARGHSATSRTR